MKTKKGWSLQHWGSDLEAAWSDGSHWEGEIVKTGCASLRQTRGEFCSALFDSEKRPSYHIDSSSGAHTRSKVARISSQVFIQSVEFKEKHQIRRRI